MEQEILSTKDYSIFKTLNGNRPVEKQHVNRLATSVDKNNLLYMRPIIVNEQMEVIDGQHRLEVAKLLNVEIYYIFSKTSDFEDVVTLNSCQENWRWINFINMFASQGYPEYIKLKKICDQFPFLNGERIALIFRINPSKKRCYTSSNSYATSFKAGEFVFDLKEELVISLISRFLEICDFYKKKSLIQSDRLWFLGNKNFFLSFVKFYRGYRRQINWAEFFEQLEKNVDTFGPKTDSEAYLNMFLSIYNWKKRLGKLEKMDFELGLSEETDTRFDPTTTKFDPTTTKFDPTTTKFDPLIEEEFHQRVKEQIDAFKLAHRSIIANK